MTSRLIGPVGVEFLALWHRGGGGGGRRLSALQTRHANLPDEIHGVQHEDEGGQETKRLSNNENVNHGRESASGSRPIR